MGGRIFRMRTYLVPWQHECALTRAVDASVLVGFTVVHAEAVCRTGQDLRLRAIAIQLVQKDEPRPQTK